MNSVFWPSTAAPLPSSQNQEVIFLADEESLNEMGQSM